MTREIFGRSGSRETVTGDGAGLARERPEVWGSESRIVDKLRAIDEEASEKPVLISSWIGGLLSIKARAAALLGGVNHSRFAGRPTDGLKLKLFKATADVGEGK